MNHITGVNRKNRRRHTQRATTRHPPTSAGCLEPLQPPAQDFVFHVSFVLVRTQMKYVNARPDPNCVRKISFFPYRALAPTAIRY
jgi:hypothetical protein